MSAATPHEPVGAASRHGRAADALISSYLRELVADDEVDAPAAQSGTLATPAADPAATDTTTTL
jgi:hypothetical protein